MISILVLATSASTLSQAEAERMGVYVMAGVVGLAVTGLIVCAKKITAELQQREAFRQRINDISTR